MLVTKNSRQLFAFVIYSLLHQKIVDILLVTCQNIRPLCLEFIYVSMQFQPNSIHIDLRAMNSVQFYPPYQSVRIGAGALWQHVLNIVDPKMHTVIHGNVSLEKVGLLCFIITI